MALNLEFLKKKAGPLTYGEWSIVGAGGIAIAYWYKKKYGSSSSTSAADAYDPLGNSAVSPAGTVDNSGALGSTVTGTGTTDTGTSTSGTGTTGTVGGYVDNTPTVTDTNGSSAGAVGSVSPAAPAVGGTYTVQSGDNWLNVASRAGVSEEALLAVNAARGPSALRIGETLYLPAGATTPASSGGTTTPTKNTSTPAKIVGYYIVASGDNWITVAQRAGVTESALIGANPSAHGAAMKVGQSVAIPSPGRVPAHASSSSSSSSSSGWTVTNQTSAPTAKYYTVKSGDNWVTVASKFGISESKLLSLNSGRGPSALRIGESLRVS